MKLPSYSKMKPSDIEWLGAIPEHWEVLRMKYVSSINDETLSETTYLDYEFLYIDIGSVDAAFGVQKKELLRFEDAPSRARRKVRHGDVIVSTVRTYLRAIAPIIEPEDNLIVSTGFAVVRPRQELSSGFAAYMLRAPYFVDAVVARSVGVSYPAINASEIGNLCVAIPPPREQHTTATYLDRETARIDALIEKKQRQIELLQEKRAAVISHAVTKGLDPNVKMKDSGIEWQGEIPEHWEVVPLRWYFQIGSGSFIPNTDFEAEPTSVLEIPVIGGNGVMAFTNRSNIDNPTLVIGRVGAYCGNVHLVSSPAWITDNALMLSRIRAFKLGYLALILEIANLNRLAKQNTQPLVTGTMVKEQSASLPPTDEQKQILEFINSETIQVKALTEKISKSIDLLREYCTALISAAVTGKIDVRGTDERRGADQ